MPITEHVDLESIKSGLKALIVERLKLERDPATIQDEQPLFGDEGGADGLSLDSVEALEIVVGIEERWGVVIEDDSVANEFYSIETLSILVKRLLDTTEAASA
jgi:acyl carrier protein